MKELLQFLFLVDLSGSMVGENIAIINAVFQECLAELRLLKDSGYFDVRVSIFTFAEKLVQIKREEAPDSIAWNDIQITPGADGFFDIASRKTLYEGLDELCSAGGIQDGAGGTHTYIFLFSDGRLVDPAEYGNALHKVKTNNYFLQSVKIAALTAGAQESNSGFALEFTGGRAENIIPASEAPQEISKLRLNLYAAGDQSGLNANEFQ